MLRGARKDSNKDRYVTSGFVGLRIRKGHFFPRTARCSGRKALSFDAAAFERAKRQVIETILGGLFSKAAPSGLAIHECHFRIIT